MPSEQKVTKYIFLIYVLLCYLVIGPFTQSPTYKFQIKSTKAWP